MDANIAKVNADIEAFLAPELTILRTTVRNSVRSVHAELARQTALSVDFVAVAFSDTTPLRPDLLVRLARQLADHPEMLRASDYPSNILEWIKHNLLSWDDPNILGWYVPDKHHIDLFWLSIVLCAQREKWQVDALTCTVLIHEWAHAFTHLGEHIDGGCLSDSTFSNLSPAICEGLAQYWTHYSLKDHLIWHAAFHVYVELMKRQPQEYRAHIPWIDPDDFKEAYLDATMIRSLDMPLPYFLNFTGQTSIREIVRAAFLTLLLKNNRESQKCKIELAEMDNRIVDQVGKGTIDLGIVIF